MCQAGGIGGSYGWYAADAPRAVRRVCAKPFDGAGRGAPGGEITTRTGLPQSAVSGCVARLKDVGSVLTAPDPADRRRTLLRRNPEVSERRAEVAATPIEAALGAALGTADTDEIARTVTLLEQLAALLSLDVLGRLR
ncbi:hypothetical protein [Streptomyces sp. YKOK-I1]